MNLNGLLMPVTADSARYAFASQLAVLRTCPNVISRLLKNGGSVLLAAKILVISRLLHTKMSQRAKPPLYLESLRDRLGSLRRKLLNTIDKRFKSLDVARDALLEAMCAFSLATSSSAKDVLRHYHHVCQGAIIERIDHEKPGKENILVALQLYIRTLRDTQALVPNQLARALEDLKTTPLIKSPDVHCIADLNFDIYERWLGNDIQIFTPYTRHNDLSDVEAEKSSNQWAKSTFSTFLGILRKRIQDDQDPRELIQLRKQVLDLWLSNRRHAIMTDFMESFNGLRNVFNIQATRIGQIRSSKLNSVVDIVESILHDWQPEISGLTLSLWDSSTATIELSDGSRQFRECLTNRSLGKNEALSKVVHEYKAFLVNVEAVEEMITKMRKTNWTDDVDEVEDDDDLLDSKQTLLGEDDPNYLQEWLKASLSEAYNHLERTIDDLLPQKGDEFRSPKSCFLLRIWRELRQHTPSSYSNLTFGLSSVASLYTTNAEEVLHPPSQKCSRRLQRLFEIDRLPTRPLWEGDPQLPVLPSPWTHRLLLDLVESMTACGSDIWSPQATQTLKKALIVRISPLIEKLAFDDRPSLINGHVNGPTSKDELREAQKEQPPSPDPIEENPTTSPIKNQSNGHFPTNSTPSAQPANHLSDLKTQTLFDISYLINATSIKVLSPAENALLSLQGRLVEDIALEAKSIERIEHIAIDY